MAEQLNSDSSNNDSIKVPELDLCPRCGAKPIFSYLSFNGGTQVYCYKCHFHPRETLASTDYEAAIKWNNLCRSLK